MTILQSRPNSAKTVKYVNGVVSPSQTALTAATSLGLELPLNCVPIMWNKKIWMSICTLVSHVHELSNACDSVPVWKTEKLLLDIVLCCYLIFLVCELPCTRICTTAISTKAIFRPLYLGAETFICWKCLWLLAMPLNFSPSSHPLACYILLFLSRKELTVDVMAAFIAPLCVHCSSLQAV